MLHACPASMQQGFDTCKQTTAQSRSNQCPVDEPACQKAPRKQLHVNSPVQLSLDVLRTEGVVFPVGQAWQPGVAEEALPPADQVPTVHSWQPALPNTG